MWGEVLKILDIIFTLVCMSISFTLLMRLFLDKAVLTRKRVFKYAVIVIVVNSLIWKLDLGSSFYNSFNTILIASMLNKGKKSLKLSALFMAFSINYACELLTMMGLFFTLGDTMYDYNKWWTIFLTHFLNTLMVLAIVRGLNQLRIFKKNELKAKVMSWQGTIGLILSALSTIVLVLMAQLIFTNRVELIVNVWFISLCVYTGLFCSIGFIIAIDENTHRQYYKKIYGLMQNQLKLQLNHYQSLENINKETRAIKHDMCNHMVAMRGLVEEGKTEEVKVYINQITKSISKRENIIQTGNTIIDAILNEKYIEACKRQIRMEVDMNMYGDLKIDIVDLCVIIANSIDNALEACEKIEEIEKRSIKVVGQVEGGYLLFQVNNSIKEPIKIIDNEFKTNKQDAQNHGYGLINIRNSVEKYKGQLKLKCEEYYFYLDITINMYSYK